VNVYNNTISGVTMKTTLVKDLGYEIESYPLEDLENGDELKALIQEYEAMLQPCIHCGREFPHIEYYYRPDFTIRPDTRHPHEVYVKCCRWHSDMNQTPGCRIQTSKLYAEDDDGYADFKEALRMVAVMWNRRPGDPADPTIEEAYSPKVFLLADAPFKNNEEVEAFLNRRRIGKPWDTGKPIKLQVPATEAEGQEIHAIMHNADALLVGPKGLTVAMKIDVKAIKAWDFKNMTCDPQVLPREMVGLVNNFGISLLPITFRFANVNFLSFKTFLIMSILVM